MTCVILQSHMTDNPHLQRPHPSALPKPKSRSRAAFPIGHASFRFSFPSGSLSHPVPPPGAVTAVHPAMSPPHSPLLPSSHPDDAGVPLIAHETTPQDADDDPARSVHLHLQSRAEDALSTPALFTWLLAAGAGVSGLLFGYEYVHCHPST